MAEKIHTDVEALYGIREAIARFAEDIQSSQHDFSECFGRIGEQFDTHIKKLREAEDTLKSSINQECNSYEEEKYAAERNKDGRTDSFCCRKCNGRIMLKIMGDETKCREANCDSMAVRIYNNSKYQMHVAKMEQIKQQIEDMQKQVNRINEELIEAESLKKRFNRVEERIMNLLSPNSDPNPDSVISFINKSIGNVSDYNAVTLSVDNIGPQKKDKVDNEDDGRVNKFLGLFTAKKIETCPEVKQQLAECGITKVDFTGVPKEYQTQIANAVVTMCNNYPELKGYIDGMYIGKLRSGVLACAGPAMSSSGFNSEIIISKEAFTSHDLEHRLNQMGRVKWNGQKWLAGRGIEGVIKHEMSHLLHLKLISDSHDFHVGDNDADKQAAIEQDYMRNAIVAAMCYSAVRELGIPPNDIARNLSTYGAHDFGECFAEAMSEYETAEHPRQLCTLIHNKYINYFR